MKIGDLVMLSSYGKQRKRAMWIEENDIGIIVQHKPYDDYPDDFLVRWQKSDWATVSRRWTHERHNTRTDLKYAKL